LSSISQTREQDLKLTNTFGNSSGDPKPAPSYLNPVAKWLVYAALGAFCIYRLIGFKPQPLDAPGTLRPILYSIFSWFVGRYGTPEEAFIQWSGICSLALLAPVALAVLHFARRNGLIRMPRKVGQILCSRQLFFFSVTICLVLCRFPTLLQKEFNPDESGFIAAANKLFIDPNFFHSVDCQTNGPLNIYALMLPAIVGLSPDFASSRVLAIGIVVLCVIFFYRTIASIAPEELGRLAVLPFVAAMAVIKNTELRHYSSEYVPMLLISCALYLSVSVLKDPVKHRFAIFSLGFLSTAAFFAKMQSVPIVLSLGLVAIAYVYLTGNIQNRWRPALLFVTGAMPLIVVNAAMCIGGGVWRDFWIAYIRANVYYAQAGDGDLGRQLHSFIEFLLSAQELRFFFFTVVAFSAAYLVERFRRRVPISDGLLLALLAGISTVIAAALTLLSLDSGTIQTYLTLVAIWAVPIYCAVQYGGKRVSIRSLDWFGLLTFVFISASFYSIYKSHRAFYHYLLFLFLPLSTGMSWVLLKLTGSLATGELATEAAQAASGRSPRGLPFIGLFLVFTLAYQTYAWGFQDSGYFNTRLTTIRTNEGDFIRSLTDPGATVFVWGWNSQAFLSAGRESATRDLHIVNCFRTLEVGSSPPKPNRTRNNEEISDFYVKRAIRDLHANRPELFVDSVSFVSWFINDRNYYSFEQFPELDRFIKTNYVLLTQRYEPGAGGGQGLERYYLRRDLLAKWTPERVAKSCAEYAVACFELSANTASAQEQSLSPRDLPPVELPAHALIEAEFVPMGLQVENATVFNNEAVAKSFRGFRFQSIGGDRYRLLLGLGDRWAFSKSVLLPQGKRASISIEVDKKNVYLRCNGIAVDDMELSSPVANASGEITVGSWIDGQCPFSGSIPFFQIVDLRHARKSAA